MRSENWRFAVAPSNAAAKNCNIGAQLQSLRCIIAPKLFWKIYFLYDLVCTNLFIPSRFWTTSWQLLSCCQRYITSCENNLCKCTSTFSALNYCSGIFFKSVSYLYEVVRINLSPIFGLFAIFDHNFAKIVAPPSNKNENYVVHHKEQSILKKSAENRIKIEP